MIDEFTSLEIDGSFIREIIFMPSQSIRMSVLRAPESDEARPVSIQHSLYFQGIHFCSFKFDAQPWLEVKAHNTLVSSEYLQQCHRATRNKTQSLEGEPEIRHFQLVLDEGRIDVIAEHFSTLIEKEIPHHGRSDPLS